MNIKMFFILCYANSLSSCHLPVTKLVQRENHVCAIISMCIRQKDGAKLPPFSYVDTEYSTWCRHSRSGPGSILNSTIDLYELP